MPIFSSPIDGFVIRLIKKAQDSAYTATCMFWISVLLKILTGCSRLTFAGGIRACIGWRFAVYEVFALTVEIINNFELGVTPDIDRLRREACLVMIPTLEGEQHKGENLPLRVSPAPRDWIYFYEISCVYTSGFCTFYPHFLFRFLVVPLNL